MTMETENNFLDISKLLSGETESISFDLGPFSDQSEENGILVSELRFFGEAKNLTDTIRLTGTVTGTLTAPCARCLTPVERAFSATVSYPVVTSEEESEEEVLLAEGQKVDLISLMQETVVTEMPLRLLCKEDCKGLCPKCGKDLNTGECGCEHKEIDPRLAGLADFFK